MGEELEDTWSESLDQDFCTSTPLRPAPMSSSLVSSSSSLLSVLDNGTGTVSPEQVLSLWRDEGLREGPQVLQVLDFPGDEPVSLSDLSSVLQNELSVSSNSVHQAALICFRTEILHLQSVLEQSLKEKDKLGSDLEKSEFRNQQLLREMDDRQVAMETRVTDRIRQVELTCRGRVSELRSQLQQEVESVQTLETERSALHRILQELTTAQTHQQGELWALTQENLGLHQDLSELRLKLKESETSFNKQQQELESLLVDKFNLEPGGGATSPERLTEIIREYEEECRELRDRNDELTSELLKSQRKTRRSRNQESPRVRRKLLPVDRTGLSSLDSGPISGLASGLDPDPVSGLDLDLVSGLDPGLVSGLDPGLVSGPSVSGLVSGPSVSNLVSGPSVSGLVSGPLVSNLVSGPSVSGLVSGPLVSNLVSGPSVSGPSVSLQTELALEQLRQNHQEEVHELQVKMETQVNYYERSLEQMRRSMELERKDICQSFKMEICELEEQKSELETQLKTMKDQVEKDQQRATESREQEQSKRLQRERAEMEQNFAREISNLVQKLSSEKDQVEAELRLRMDQGHLVLRSEAECREAELRVVWENQMTNQERETQHLRASLVQSEERLQEACVQLMEGAELQDKEAEMQVKEAGLQGKGAGIALRAERDVRLCEQLSSQTVEMEDELQRLRLESEQRLGHMEALVRRLETEDSAPYRTQVDDLRSENVALLERVSLLQQEVTSLEEEVDRKRRKTEETEQERETQRNIQERLNKENLGLRQQVLDLSSRNLELSSSNAEMSLRIRRAEDHNDTLQRLKEELVQSEREKQQLQVEQSATKRTEDSLRSQEKEAESLRVQLQSANQEAQTMKQEVTHTQQRLKEAHHKWEESDLCLKKLITEKQEVTSSLEDELQIQRIRNQELQSKVAEVHTQDQEIQRLNRQLLELKTQVEQLERTKNQAQDQVLRADTALSVIQSQHLRQIHQIQTESKSQTETRTRAELDSALEQLRDERERRERVERELEEREMGDRQGEQEVMSHLSLRTEDLQLQLKATRGLLQEKSSELKEQVSRCSSGLLLLQQVQLQQSDLMVALQQTEHRLSETLNHNRLLQKKNQTLNQLLRRLVPEALS